jgi:hypothetical protein
LAGFALTTVAGFGVTTEGIAQISAPGIAASLNKTAPGLAAKLQQVPYIGLLMQQAAPLKNIPGMATAAMAAPLAEGMETGDLAPNPNPQPQTAPASPNAASPNGSSLLKIMSRHIPVIGRGLRANGYGAGVTKLSEWPGALASARGYTHANSDSRDKTAFLGVVGGTDRLSCAAPTVLGFTFTIAGSSIHLAGGLLPVALPHRRPGTALNFSACFEKFNVD